MGGGGGFVWRMTHGAVSSLKVNHWSTIQNCSRLLFFFQRKLHSDNFQNSVISSQQKKKIYIRMSPAVDLTSAIPESIPADSRID